MIITKAYLFFNIYGTVVYLGLSGLANSHYDYDRQHSLRVFIDSEEMIHIVEVCASVGWF